MGFLTGRLVRTLRPGVAATLGLGSEYRHYWLESNQRARHTDGPLWVAVGDSTAQGIGASAPDHGYVGQLLARLRDEQHRPWRVVNLSATGARIADVAREQVPRINDTGEPELVTCAAGANDVIRFGFRRVVEALRDLIRALPTRAVIATIPQGLYDPEAPNAADRLALLEWLADRGLSVEQIAEAGAAGRLTAIAGDLALRPGPRLSMVEVAENTELTVEQIRQLSLTIGLPVEDVDERIYTPGDVEVFKLFGATTELFPESSLMQFVRVLGSSLARIADAAVSLFLADVETPITEAQAGELALARAQLDAIGALDLLTDHLQTLFRAHMELAIRRNTAARTEATSKVTVYVAVGFVDLVGFTPLSQRLHVRELHSTVDAFEGSA